MLAPFLVKLTGSDTFADDIIQESFLRVWLYRDKLPEVEYPRAWIYRIVANQSHNWINRNIAARKAIHRHQEGQPLTEDPTESGLYVREMLAVIQQAVTELPAQRRTIYRMNREQSMKVTEIAEELHLSIHTVKNTLAAALRSIRKKLEERGYLLLFIILFTKKVEFLIVLLHFLLVL